MLFHGCTNIYLRKIKSKFLDSKTIGVAEKLCYDKPERLLKKYKYYAMGTNIIYFAGLMLIIKYQ